MHRSWRQWVETRALLLVGHLRQWVCMPLVLGFVVALLFLWEPAAWARVGGGQGFSGGGGGGGFSGGGGGGGSSDAVGHLIVWLIRLCWYYPEVGIPLLIVTAVVLVLQNRRATKERPYVSHRTERRSNDRRRVRTQHAMGHVSRMREADPNFSMPLFVDFVQLVYARAQHYRYGKQDAVLRPFVGPQALEKLRKGGGNLDEVRDVIFGSTKVQDVRTGRQWTRVIVAFETNITEIRGGNERQLLSRERWTFRRKAGIRSPGPGAMATLGCGSCGSTLEVQLDGRCPNCDQVRGGGVHHWEVCAINLVDRKPVSAPQLSMGSGIEAGTREPTVVCADLDGQKRAFFARHPNHVWDHFDENQRLIFMKLQDAWSSRRWELSRPYQTDALFQVHRFWMERYARGGLVNRLDEIEVFRTELVKVEMDAYFESVTTRIFARMLDWTEDVSTGKVVGGSKKKQRTFSEYWTFIRGVGAESVNDEWNVEACPSCGAPLDNVTMAGVCEYCEAKITTGAFDWVLSRIEQDESYGG